MMLLRFLKYPYASTRARTLAMHFYGLQDLQTLSGKAGYEEAFSSLKKERQVQEGTEEVVLEGALLGYDFLRLGRKLVRLLPRKEARVIQAWLGRIDLQNLNVACRGLLRERQEKTWKNLLVPPGPESGIPLLWLKKADSPERLSELLRKTPYGEALRSGLGRTGEQRLFLLETDLERIFWAQVRDSVRDLSFFDRQAAAELFGLRADIEIFNLLVRGLEAGMENEDIQTGLPPFGMLFTPERVSRILGRDDPQGALQAHLPSKVENLSGPEGNVVLYRRMYRILQKRLREPPFDISASLAALLLKEIENRDLRIVLGGLRFEKEPEDLQDLLACAV